MDFMKSESVRPWRCEFGFIGSRMRLVRKVIVGFWQDTAIHAEIVLATGRLRLHDAQHLKVARLGDNMRKRCRDRWRQSRCRNQTALYGEWLWVGDLVKRVQQVTDPEIKQLTE